MTDSLRWEGVVGPVAHGGHCVLRPSEGPVVFVRHALPGERVVVEITEGAEGDRFWRGDAVEVLEASPDRVQAPCPYSGPHACGGCDFQHVDLAAQRRLKASVVREQLQRLADLEWDVEVEAVPGDTPEVARGLRWRTKQRYVDLGGGRRGMRKHRSHEVVEVDDCLIDAHHPPDPTVRGVRFEVADDGFWQVHPGAAEALVDTVMSFGAPRSGERVLDLYGGVGLFARFLAEAVGEFGAVGLVEGDQRACGHARTNLADVPARTQVVAGDVRRVLERPRGSLLTDPVDLVVLDPPRQGAKRAVVAAVAQRRPSRVVYVACDPAALARDVAYFADAGYVLTHLRALDLFPMTHHVECVALLTKTGSDLQ
ncbi:class I SAM-dependent RNA methyltransferase [Nocardioides acrostichi]|uniref:Class I SAM-dependent RNA methyltransferase n=1 Tax=Nocardioides acrostichi TaxID=2784339 RepID=A0A930UZM2_9ACTN|nr:class I SAM-dependent RNA methyltransferase [Nocardioides acrostichi]MBF4160980.1 class I SAM-dependent RNA methyltransferase [Nocardioides acrostichi]